MKVFTLIIFTLLSVFFQKHSLSSNSQTHQVTNVLGTNTGSTYGNSQCTAKHVEPTDPQAFLPDPNCTPGVTNPNVTQANIYQTICVTGYTQTIRPPVSYTDTLKVRQIQQYGYIDTNPRDYEEDHFISLELGGNPTDVKNLWPEPHPSSNEKDKVENYLHDEVCKGTISLKQAQNEITQNWYGIYLQIK